MKRFKICILEPETSGVASHAHVCNVKQDQIPNMVRQLLVQFVQQPMKANVEYVISILSEVDNA